MSTLRPPPRPMPSAPSRRKPHLYKGKGGCWFCLDGLWLGWGMTPKSAYQAWKSRGYECSCVHDRATPLQRRMREAVKRIERPNTFPLGHRLVVE